MSMFNLFEKYLNTQAFSNIDLRYLDTNFIPNRLPHREREINLLAENFGTALMGTPPRNIFIYGKTGTGKTAVTRFVGRELLNYSGEKRISFIYMNCEVKDNSYSVFETIGNSFSGEQIPFTGWSFDRLYSTVKKKIDQWNGIVIVVLDEIDKFILKNGDDVLYQILLLNSELERSKITIVGITNDVKLSDFLDSRIKSRLNEEKIVFSPYTSSDLFDILKDRVYLAKLDNYVSDENLKLISTLAAQENGDARRAIELLKTSVYLALSNGEKALNEKYVYLARAKMDSDAIAESIRMLPVQSKILLLSIALLYESGNTQVNTGEVFEAYRNLAIAAGLPVLTPRRITDMLSDLDMQGLVSAKVKSLGRYGRTKLIDLSIPVSEVKKVILQDENLSKLNNYSLPKQSRLL